MIEVNKDWFVRLAELAEKCDNIVISGNVLSNKELMTISQLIGYASSAKTFIKLSE